MEDVLPLSLFGLGLSKLPVALFSEKGAKPDWGRLCLGAAVSCSLRMVSGPAGPSNSRFSILKLSCICMFHGKHCVEVGADGSLKQLCAWQLGWSSIFQTKCPQESFSEQG